MHIIAAPEGDPASREGGRGANVAEHVIVGAHRVVEHEQLASEGLVVEIAGEIAHLPPRKRVDDGEMGWQLDQAHSKMA